ncbi:hypothetical protein [Actinomadura opuntiae]|uniref:hypothetical protein n=1 Tax=Actinomadura sp. OS1-43 TaxID=604315 RepID=UPI00255A9F8B|nr:hypothetical protein [Actinomadura sp. OS1-43]MDL4820056.1 hypothetical protein [Actinomadura sp. OS1-43]
MKRSLACAAAVAAALLSAPVTAHADEGTFTSVSLPFFWPTAELDDVAADTSGGVWIGGAQGEYCVVWADNCALYSNGAPVLRRWKGSSWTEYPLNGWTGQGQIGAIASSGAETWVAGGPTGSSGFHDYLARFDGTAFQKVDKPSQARLSMISTGPAGTWVSQVTGAGDPTPRLQKRTGSTWTGYALPIGDVSDLQARSATDAWAVGGSSTASGTAPAIAHYDGTSWTGVTPPTIPAGANDAFVKVVPVGATDVWALTWKYLTHWNGTGWTVIPLPDGIARGGDLAVAANGTVWVAPADYGTSTPYLYSGGSWHAATLPAGLKMYDITAVPGTSTIWGVAHKGTYSDPAALKNS